MFLNSAYNQREVIKSICGNISKDMETLKKRLLDFINESELEGKSYDSAKKYLDSTYIPLINGFILLSDEIVQAQEKFIEQYKSRVDVNSLQSEVLENQIYRINRIIYELQSMTPFNSIVGFGIENMIFSYQYSKNKIEEKLENLINFNDSSVEIFSDVESLLNDVKKGILEISSTGSWDSVNKVFISNSSNSEWATNLNDKYYKKELDLILNKIPNLTESDIAKLEEYASNYEGKDVSEDMLDTLKAIDKTIEGVGGLATKNLIFREFVASVKKIKNGTWYGSPVKSTKTGYKTWKQVNGDVKRFKKVKKAKKLDEILNGTGDPKTLGNGVTKITPKSVAKSVGVLGGISAVLDGGTTYLERKDKYGEVSAMVDGVAHTASSVGAIYVGALIGTAIFQYQLLELLLEHFLEELSIRL